MFCEGTSTCADLEIVLGAINLWKNAQGKRRWIERAIWSSAC